MKNQIISIVLKSTCPRKIIGSLLHVFVCDEKTKIRNFINNFGVIFDIIYIGNID